MRYLLDVNFLIALLIGSHIHNSRAHRWWKEHIDAGWASCAITENGFVPIVSQQGFAAPLSVTEAINVLRDAKDDSDSEYGPDDLSITDAAKFGSKAVTPIGRNHRCLPFGNGRSKAKLLGNF